MVRKSVVSMTLFALLVVSFVTQIPTVGRDGVEKQASAPSVWVEARVEHVSETLTIDLAGAAGAPVLLAFEIYSEEAPLVPAAQGTLPLMLDINGEAQLVFGLHDFDQTEAFAVVLRSVVPGATSDPWVIRLQRFPAGPQAPALGGGSTEAPLSGTAAPLFHASWAALLGHGVVNPGGDDVMYFTSFRPGIEGVLPVH